MSNELKNLDSSGVQYTTADLDKVCSVCAAGVDKKDECAKLVRNPKAAEEMCSCWALQKPTLEYNMFLSNIYKECKSVPDPDPPDCKLGNKTLAPNPLFGTFGPEILSVKQKCSDKRVPGSTNYSKWITYTKALADWTKQYGPGGQYSTVESDGKTPRPTNSYESGWCPPWADTPSTPNGWYYCGTGNLQATGTNGNGTYCSSTPVQWGSPDSVTGWGYAKATSNQWKYDASFISNPTCTNEQNCKKPGQYIKDPGIARLWEYSVTAPGRSVEAGNVECKMTAQQKFIVPKDQQPNPPPKPDYQTGRPNLRGVARWLGTDAGAMLC